MNFLLLTVGKPARGAVADAAAMYRDRLERYAAFREYAIRPPRGAFATDELRRRESDLLLAEVPATGHLVALDERGRSMTSLELARFFSDHRDRGERQFVFAIGGAAGHAPAVRERAQTCLALSSLTFPHEIARLLLLEQLYRACTILAGEPYHKA